MRWVVSEREQIQAAAARWKARYCEPDGRWRPFIGGSAQLVYDGLIALGPNATVADVDAIIGTTGWVGDLCSECQRCPAVIALGPEPEHESAPAGLCAACIRRLAAFLDAGPPQA